MTGAGRFRHATRPREEAVDGVTIWRAVSTRPPPMAILLPDSAAPGGKKPEWLVPILSLPVWRIETIGIQYELLISNSTILLDLQRKSGCTDDSFSKAESKAGQSAKPSHQTVIQSDEGKSNGLVLPRRPQTIPPACLPERNG